MKTIVNGITMAYEENGAGPAVLLIHGFPLCRRMWRFQVELLAEAGYRVITPDLRGFGESEATDGPYSMTLFADDVVGLMDHLGVENAVVGGMSMGGYVLLNLLERYPQRVAAALFIVTRSDADNEAGKDRRTTLAQEIKEGRPQVVTEAFETILFAEDTPRHKPDLVAEVKGWMAATDPRGLAGGLLAIRDRKGYTAALGGCTLPALVIGAQQDRAIPPENAEILAKGLPNSTLHIISGAGHMANLEQPEAFNGCLLEFLNGLYQK
jgi:pimeloyl-ACP methyl ester carboxylesterase